MDTFGKLLLGWKSRGGNVAMVFALTLPVIVGGAGLGVETTSWYFNLLRLQTAADAAAYAGAMEMRAGSSTDRVTQVGTLAATQNGFNTGSGSIQVNVPPQSGAVTTHAVEVVLNTTTPRYFTRIFSHTPLALSARAVAVYNTAADACVLALNRTASKAALFSGSSSLALNGCSVMANSVANDAVTVQGAAQLSTNCVISAGGAQTTSGLTETTCAAPITQAPPVADPFANLSPPLPGGGCQSSSGGALQPGSYCNGLNLSGTVTLNPGVYVISGGNFKINANANISGSGVTFYLVGNSNVSFNGNATMQLSAPTSGTYSGMLFFGDRSGTGNNTFNGTASSQLTGAIYFPTEAVNYLGNFSGQQGCTQIVADTVQWSGNTSISVDCTNYGMTAIPAMSLVKLVE